MPEAFDGDTLRLLDKAQEVEIETTRPDRRLQRTTIWVMVDGEEVFVRSVRGERGNWYQAAIDRPDEVALLVDAERIPVRVELADDDESVERCTRALESKYAPDASLATMVQPHNLATTLRLCAR